MSFFNNIGESILEVNRKYAKPEIEMTLFVKICLLTLRVYLLTMVGLMVYALVKDAIGGGSPSQTTPAGQTGTTNTALQVSSATLTTASGSEP